MGASSATAPDYGGLRHVHQQQQQLHSDGNSNSNSDTDFDNDDNNSMGATLADRGSLLRGGAASAASKAAAPAGSGMHSTKGGPAAAPDLVCPVTGATAPAGSAPHRLPGSSSVHELSDAAVSPTTAHGRGIGSGSSPPPPPVPVRPRRLFGVFYVHPSFSAVNFITFLLATLLSVCMFVFLSAGTSFVLTEVIGLTSGEGNASGSLAFYDELLSIVMVLVWGSLSDVVGRRAVYSIGFAVMGAGMAIYPLATNLYPQLLLARLLFAVGAAACSTMLTAVLADCAGKLRGRISGIVGLMSGLGALVGVFVLLPLPTKFQDHGATLGRGVQYTYFIAGGASVAFAAVFWFGASRHFGGATSSSSAGAAAHSVASRLAPARLLHQMRQGMGAARDPRILAAYAAGFAARGNTAIITLFIPLWVNKYYTTHGLCAVQGLDPNNDTLIKESCRAAFTRSSIVGGVTQTFALLGAPLWGILIDRFGRDDDAHDDDEHVHIDPSHDPHRSPHGPVGDRALDSEAVAAAATSSAGKPSAHRRTYSTLPLLATCVMAAVGYLLLFLLDSPLTSAIFPISFLVGVGEIGTVIVSVAMVSATYVDPRIRGAVSGAYSFSGGLGILLSTKLGGILFDSWTYTAPFLLMAIVHTVVGGIAAAVLVKEASDRRASARA
ncbi:major facilitator superfamily domain-containing protein [Blastocladiella britannica]|nr:major facilitator superfamily domain-containing protein [Blastocladiella britannica]